ncbi:FhaA domain-containing protein [Azotosporobacter soli]|uniref:FhaA domain-containing protein n=1 Tax=Azotosporobacter soli TaxID=3055040 RepID=UPI0031FF3822
MSWMRRMEGALERCIEGFFNEKLAGTLQPVEVLQQLIKTMLDKATERIAPQRYSVYLQPEEQVRLTADQTLLEELKVCLTKEAQEQQLKFSGALEIHLLPDAALAHGCLRVEATFTPSCEAESPAEDELQSTRIFAKPEFPSLALPAARPARLRIVKGADVGFVLQLGAGRINIGRLQSNDLVLADQSASRLHAYICWAEATEMHMIYDAQSLNGTKLNEVLIQEAALRDGDRIRIGSTELEYEVNT